MAEIAVLRLKFDSLSKPFFGGKKYYSKQFETSMNVEMTTIKSFCYFGHYFFKKQLF